MMNDPASLFPSPHLGREREQRDRERWSFHVQREQCALEHELEQRLRPLLSNLDIFARLYLDGKRCD